MTAFAQALLAIAVEEGNTTSIEVIRNAAFARLATGETKSLIATTINGKSFNFNVSKPADELFTESTWAIQQFNSGVVVSSTFDFLFF